MRSKYAKTSRNGAPSNEIVVGGFGTEGSRMRLRPRSFASILNASRSGTSRSSSATGSETDSGSPGGRGFGLGAGAEGTSGGASRMSLWRLEPAMPEMLLTASLRGPIISIITPPSEGETRISSTSGISS